MNDHLLSVFCLVLSAALALTALLAFGLERIRIPALVGALLVGGVLRHTPLAVVLREGLTGDLFSLLAELGILLLLFFVGLQIDLRDLRESGRDVLLLGASSMLFPLAIGTTLLLALGYEPVLALVIGMTLMPTAEIVVVPILDEFGLLHTRVGNLIVNVGTLDDVVEVALVALVSVWLGQRTAGASIAQYVAPVAGGVLGVAALFWFGEHYLLPNLVRHMPNHAYHLVTISMFVLLGFVGVTVSAGLGPLVGAIAAGLVMQPTYAHLGVLGQRAGQAFRQIAFGFFGALFFLQVGLNVNLAGVMQEPWLTLALFGAAGFGKIAGVLPFAFAKRLSMLEAIAVGVGLDARLTTEIIVAQLLFRAGLVTSGMFDALVAASALATICVPLAFSLLMRKWGPSLLSGAVVLPVRTAVSEA